jgi:hypothetical protein
VLVRRLNQQICAVLLRTKRLSEIACPPTARILAAGSAKHPPAAGGPAAARTTRALVVRCWRDFNQRQPEMLFAVAGGLDHIATNRHHCSRSPTPKCRSRFAHSARPPETAGRG